MFEVKDYICCPSGVLCEDNIAFGESYIFVLDGASGLTGKNIMNRTSDAFWFVTEIKNSLVNRFENNDSRTTSEILYEILSELHEVYFGKLSEKNRLIPADSPSAGIALFRERNGYVDFFGLGDCIGAFTNIYNKTKLLYDGALSELDSMAINYMVDIKNNQGLSLLEAKDKSIDMLIKNRKLRNKPNGYWILDLSAIGVSHAITFRKPIEQIKTISVFSDGFSQLVDCFGEFENYSQLHVQMQNNSLIDLYRKLCNLQENDPYCNEYPRFKFRDDASAVWALVKE